MMVKNEEKFKGKGTRKCKRCGTSRGLIRSHNLLDGTVHSALPILSFVFIVLIASASLSTIIINHIF